MNSMKQQEMKVKSFDIDYEKEVMGYLVPNFTARVYREENKGLLSRNGEYRVEMVELRDGKVPDLLNNGEWEC